MSSFNLTPRLDAGALLDVLKNRYAAKIFAPDKKIPPAVWSALEESLVLSQSAYGLQPWKFLVVETPQLRAQLRPHTWDQSAVTDADKFVVFLARKATGESDVDRHIARIAEVRKLTTEALAGFKDVIMEELNERAANGTLLTWASNQAYIALGQFTTAAALLGVDTCPIEGLEKAKYDEILGLAKTPFATVATVAAGYHAESDIYATFPKVRLPFAEVVARI